METTGENKRPLNLFKYSNSIMTLNRCFVKTLSVNGNHNKLAKRGIISRSSCTSCVLFFFSFFSSRCSNLSTKRSSKFRHSYLLRHSKMIEGKRNGLQIKRVESCSEF